MGIMVSGSEEQSKLQERISADLRERSRRSSKDEDIEVDDVDLVEDSEYLKNTTKTGRFSWFWFVLIALAALALVIIVVI